jgi:hypothetical protein
MLLLLSDRLQQRPRIESRGFVQRYIRHVEFHGHRPDSHRMHLERDRWRRYGQHRLRQRRVGRHSQWRHERTMPVRSDALRQPLPAERLIHLRYLHWRHERRADNRDDQQMIFLPGVYTIVYTADRPHCTARHPRVTKILNSLKFTNWRFFHGRACTPYWDLIRPEYASLLRENEPPLLILEDDIEVYDFHADIDPPAESEVVYLGGGTMGLADGIRSAIDDRWLRISGMLYAHAILWLDRRAMREAADAIATRPQPHDITLAENQARWLTVCARRPLFFQDDGRHAKETQDYD